MYARRGRREWGRTRTGRLTSRARAALRGSASDRRDSFTTASGFGSARGRWSRRVSAMTTAHNVLDEPLLSWRDHSLRRAKTTLPGLLARFGNGDLADFPRVRAHQFHPWSMFLTQLATLALRGAGETDPRLSHDAWRK